MKRIKNIVKKRSKSSQPGDDRSTGGGGITQGDSVSLGQASMSSSVATSSVLHFQKSHRSPSRSSSSVQSPETPQPNLKYTIDTSKCKDKSLTKLHIAVIREDVEKVKKYVKRGQEDVNQQVPQKRFKSLLSKEENLVNVRDRYARTPLHLCATNGNEIILWQLLSHGADVHTRDCDGATPLHRAIDAGHDETSRMILDRGCSLDVADLDGDTALHLAVRKQNNEIVAVLLRKGANPDLKNSSGECPLHESIRNGLIPTAQLLLRGGCEVNIPGPDFRTPLIIAVEDPNLITIVDNLLDYEADPMICDQDGLNAIDHVANHEMRQMLLNYVEQSTRGRNEGNLTRSSDNHSFDDDIEESDIGLNARYSIPFGNTTTGSSNLPNAEEEEQQQNLADHHPIDNYQTPVNISDLSSWESSKDEDLLPDVSNQHPMQSKLKHSQGMLNLSKFLDSDAEEEDDDDVVNVKPPDDATAKKEEKIYDSVENIPDQAAGGAQKHFSADDIPSEPDHILDAIAAYDTGDESDDWEDSPRQPQNEKTSAGPILPSPKFSPAMLPPGDESDDWDDSPRQPKNEKTAGHTLLSPKYSPVILPPVTSAKNSSPIVSPPSPVTFKSNSNISKKCSQQNQQQPKSLDLITVRPPQQLERPSSSTKRRGSRKSRSLRSTHLAMMSRPLVKSFAIDQEDSSHSSNSPSHKGDDGSKASSSKQVAKPLDNIKKEFINKLQNKNPMLSLDNSMDSLDTLGPDVPMLDPELMNMEKVDLLVHIQKVQLELNQLKKRQTTSSAENENNEKVVGELRNELAIKENECKTWMAKIEQADSLADDLRSKDKIIEELNSSLNFETTKRKQIESMFQDLTDREKIVKQELDQSKSQKHTYSEDLAKISHENQRFQRRIQDLEEELKSQTNEIKSLKTKNISLDQTASSKDSDLKDLVNQNASLKEQLDKAISEKKLIEKTSSTELEPKLEKFEIDNRAKDQVIAKLKHEKELWFDEKIDLENKLQISIMELKSAKEQIQDQKIKADLATDELEIFKKKWKERDQSQQNSSKTNQKEIQDLQHQLQRKSEDLESLSIKHANLLISTKESENLPDVNSEVASELAVVKQELKRLHGILAQKEKELVQAKLSESNAELLNDKITHMKSELINKESKLQEVELTLELERRKIETYEEHIQVLRTQIKELQCQITDAAKEKTSLVTKMKENIHTAKQDSIRDRLIDELKHQLKDENDKLKKSQRKVANLEQEKLSMEMELEDILKKLAYANNEMENLNHKVSDLENELQQERMKRQNQQHLNMKSPNYSNTNGPQIESQNKIKNLEEMLVAKDKIIEALEDKLTKVYETEASKREQEMQKIRLRYEMMARLELNSKLAEVNHFLEKRAMEHNENIKEKDLITDQIQKDLSNRLSQSRDELLKIKDQMKDTERSIHGLQRQLETRERELDDERNKRRVLEKHFEKKTEKRLLNDMAKRPPQTVKQYHHYGAHF